MRNERHKDEAAMNIRVMLRTLEEILEEEKEMQLEIERLETHAKGLGGSGYDGGHKSSQKDRMANGTIEVDLEKDRQAYRKREFYLFRQQALAIFWSLKDHAQSYVLEEYYVRGKSFREIADQFGMSKSWAEKKEKEGLRRLMR